ncbi:hypothetical protein L207DRAFT_589807 [Hyaloscypha variabilis F]|uniref:Uncharacterized protein n=1 Tax=Hyaloscypha variabilis (strain UAMH 11265 / GT02V1 / F) TaxID=1149755 RepID=A0A2J6R4L4_HYAVF|nr:hypothetical protein L207DRAFT_589807 [Hyaloscypha variabilis F]
MENTTSSGLTGGIGAVSSIYTDQYWDSPYSFSAQAGSGEGGDTLYDNPLGLLLLEPQANSSAEQVAQRIEAIFQTATLMAFAREPLAADITVTIVDNTPVYLFDQKVLLILLVPMLAVLLGTVGRYEIEGHDICVGYDPVEIARRGPIVDLAESRDESNDHHLDESGTRLDALDELDPLNEAKPLPVKLRKRY